MSILIHILLVTSLIIKLFLLIFVLIFLLISLKKMKYDDKVELSDGNDEEDWERATIEDWNNYLKDENSPKN